MKTILGFALLAFLAVAAGPAVAADDRKGAAKDDESCTLIKDRDRYHLCRGSCDLIVNRDLYHLCRKECDLIRDRDLYRLCKSRQGQ
jgi:hypothetical protein